MNNSHDSAGVLTRLLVLLSGLCVIAIGCGTPMRTDLYKMITTKPPVIAVQSIALSPAGPVSLLLPNPSARQLAVIFSPSKASDKSVDWTTVPANSNLITVSASGLVTPTGNAIDGDTVTVRATTRDGGHQASTVFHFTNQPVPLAGVQISQDGVNPIGALSLNTGDDVTLQAIFDPPGATIQSIDWQSDDPASVQVDPASGAMTALASTQTGGALVTLTVTDTNGTAKTATCTVTVVTPVTGIAFTPPSSGQTSLPGDTFTLTAQISPATASNKQIDWTVDSHLLTVANSIIISAPTVTGNTSTVTVSVALGAHLGELGFVVATAADTTHGTKSVEFGVHIAVAATALTLGQPSLSLAASSTATLTAIPTPSTATISWSSSNGAVATVNSAGVVSAGTSAGTVTIFASATRADGSVMTVSCPVTVVAPLVGNASGSLSSSGTSYSGVTMAVDATPNVYVAYVDNTQQVIVKEFQPGNGFWNSLGAVTGSSSVTVNKTGANLALAINPLGRPEVAFPQGSSGEPWVMKFDGSNWVPEGGISPESTTANPVQRTTDNVSYFADRVKFLSLAIDTLNTGGASIIPYFPWLNYVAVPSSSATVGTALGRDDFQGNWNSFAPTSFPESSSTGTGLSTAVDTVNHRVLFAGNLSGQLVMALRVGASGQSLVPVPTYSNPASISTAVDGSGGYYVAFQNDTGGPVVVLQYDFNIGALSHLGPSSGVGTGAASNGAASSTSLAILSGNVPYLAFKDNSASGSGRATLVRFDGINWIPVGIFSTSTVDNITLAADPTGNHLFLSYDSGGSMKVFQVQ